MTQVGAAASAVDAPSPLRTKRGLACFSLYARTPIWIDVVDPTSPHSLSCPFPLRVRKGEKGVSLQAEIRGLPPISTSACLSHLGFCENTACESHYCSCIGPLDSVILGPIVAFSANSGSTICNEAPLWRFLPTSSAARFRWDFRLGFSRALLRRARPGFGSGRACEGLLQEILWNLSHDLLRRLAIDVPQEISCLRLD